jgi:hypothetical protein
MKARDVREVAFLQASPEGRDAGRQLYAIDATRHCAGPDVKDSRGDEA